MPIIIGIIVLIILFFVISAAHSAGRGHKIAVQLHSFVNAYQSAVRVGALREQALRDAMQHLRQAPRFDALTDEDINMIVKTLSDLREPELLIETIVMKADSTRAIQMLKDQSFLKKIGEAKRRHETQ